MDQRNQLIDFIRGFSILSVVLLHCRIHLPIDNSLMSIWWVRLLLNSGGYGVNIFFVVSGFLITSISIKRWNNLASIDLAKFYQIRFARIMPCLLAALAVSSLLHLMNTKGFVLTNTSLEQAIFSALTFQINWLRVKTGYMIGNWDVLWSLSVEEVFYLFFPLLCIILRKPSYLIITMLAFIIAAPINRTIYADNDLWGDYAYLSCMDGIAIGCLAAMFASQARTIRTIFLLLVSGLLLFNFVFIFRKQVFDLGLTAIGLNTTLLEIGIALILIACQQINIPKYLAQFIGFRLFQWFGRNSYEIYLTHGMIITLAVNILFQANQPIWSTVLTYLIIVLISGILGHLIATKYSEPFNQYLRNKSFTRKVSYSSEE